MSSESARMEVVQSERDIQSIKGALRQVSDENQPNSLEVVWTGLEGMEVDDSVEITLQLSSPVEELSLQKIRSSDGDEDAVEGSSVSFAGVESSMATLTVTLKKGGQVLGTSEAFDMAPVCSLDDAMNPKEEYATTLPVAIVSAELAGKETKEEATEKPAEDWKPSSEEKEEEKPSEESEDKKESTEETKKEEDKTTDAATTTATETTTKEESPAQSVVKPLCTLSLKMIFKPSAKDQKEALYELLNKASLRRSQALDRHRGEQRTAMTTASPSKKPAVKPGFLNNKKQPKKEESKIMEFYNKYLGPKSLGRGVIFPIAKNYVIFFGAIVMMHFKGQELALPAPV